MSAPPNAGSNTRVGWREIAFALVVGAIAYAVSCALVWPDPATKGFGAQFQLMSTAPFDLLGQFPHRILVSLLAWVCGLGGPVPGSGEPERFLYFMRGLYVVLLACVCLYARWLGARHRDGLLIALAVAVTAPVQMYKQHWVGLCDPLAYALALVAAMCVRNRRVFWLLFLANLLTHELAIFLAPWFWFLRRQVDDRWRGDLVWFAAVVAAYGAFYLLVRSIAQPTYAVDFFLANPLFPWGALGCWMMALTHLLLAYGPVLAVLGWHWHSRQYGRERWQLWLVVAGIGMILAIAFDFMRHANLVLLPFVLASVRFLTAGHRLLYAGLVVASAGLLLWVPPWSGHAPPTYELWGAIDEHVIAARDFSRVVTHWIPAVWPTLAVIYALLAAVWLLGFAIARWTRRAGQLPAA
ncbi:MAG: hypothetical protein JNL08_01800 [Planctomycetes bacterium]|nr:hypothetical protein [Planctomycetota bacterium]